MRSIKGVIRTRGLPLYDLISDILVARMLTLGEDSDRKFWVTGSSAGDARIAWILIAIPWCIVLLAVALFLVQQSLHVIRGDETSGPFSKHHTCSWWCKWGLAVTVLLLAPALVAAPFVTIYFELYLICMCPDGRVPRKAFVAR